MKMVASIIMSLFIIVEVITMLFGDASMKIWSVVYFCNQSILIIGLLMYLREYLNNILINIIISLSIVKITYNCLLLLSEKWSSWVNDCYYVGLIIAVSILLTLIFYVYDKKRIYQRGH